MKKIIFILLISAFSKNVSAQSGGVPDTLVYLQTIIANKSQYIGQPFSTLQNSLQIQIKYFSPFSAMPQDKSKETSTSFAFYFPQTADNIYLIYPCLTIFWSPYLNADQSDILFSQYDGGKWNSAVYDFYKNGIITDIQILE